MEVLQGRYLEPNDAKAHRLKAMSLETADGIRLVKLPKALSAIAQQELSPGDMVRVWAEPMPQKISQKAKKKSKNAGLKNASKKGKREVLKALQLIPLSPKPTVSVPLAEIPVHETAGKKARKKTARKKRGKPMRVQLCQKKNCCKRGGTQLWEAFQQTADTPAVDLPAFKLEAVGCLGGCKRGPNLRVLPANVKHYHVQPQDIERILQT